MANATNTLNKTMTWASFFNRGRPCALAGNEPALTSANCVMQAILGPPFEWRWNRNEYQFTCLNPAAAWTTGTAYALGYSFKDPNGNMQRVTSIGSAPNQSGSVQPTWSTNLAGMGTTSDGNLTWTVNDIQTYVISCPDFAWIEHASVQDITLPIPKWYDMQPEMSLSFDSSTARPRFISAHYDDGNGNIGFTMTPVPNQAYPVMIHIQKKAVPFTDILQTWAPIPDEFAYIYSWGFLTMMWLFADDARYQMANAKFVAHLLGANQGLDETARSIFLQNWSNISGIQQATTQQGLQARSNQ
jgi:hypothetical protein